MRGETMLDETNLDEDLDTETEYDDATHRMIALGYAVSALLGAIAATVFWAVVWVVARQ